MRSTTIPDNHERRLAPILFRAGIAASLRLFPQPFRRAYGSDMLELFEVRCRDEWQRGGARAATLLFRRSLVDLWMTAWRERRRSSFERQPSPGRSLPPTRPRKGDGLVSTLLKDLTFSLRSFARQPAFTAVVVITLALGIGANTAIFSVVNGVLLSPLPYDDSHDLIDIWGRFDPVSGFDYPIFPLSPPEFVDYRAQSRAFEDVAAFTTFNATITSGDGDPERVTVGSLSANTFALLRVEAATGRVFTPEEDNNAADVVVLEHGYWQTRFAGDVGIVGKTIIVNGTPQVVVGIMPEGFRFLRDARMWAPLGIDPGDPGNRQSHFIRGFGRLAEGSTLEAASAEMETLMAAWETEFPEIHTGHYLYLNPMIDDVVGSVRPALVMLLSVAGLVLLIVCANVASVVLARGEDRSREIAIRSALGAGRWQIVRLLLVESFLLSAVGGVLGILLAGAGVQALMVAGAESIPRADTIAVNAVVLGFGAAVTFLAAVLFGLFPAFHGASTQVHLNLKEGSAGASPSRTRLYFRRALVVAEVALSFFLVLSAGLMLKGFGNMVATDPGFETDGVMVARIGLPAAQYPSAAAVRSFYDELVQRIEGVPGVERASASSDLPLAGGPGVWDFRVDGQAVPGPGEQAWNAGFSAVRPGFFDVMRTRVLRGRAFQDADTAESQLVGLVNQSFVDKFFNGGDALGERVMVCCPDEGVEAPWMTIVGVVDDIRYEGLNLDPRPMYYGVHDQVERVSNGGVFGALAMVVRYEGDDAAVASSLRALVRELDADLPVVGLATMDGVVADSVARPRFIARLLGLFAAVALILGATGIYGVLAYTVAQRGREIGIRKALGAAQGRLAGMVVAQGMSLVSAGLTIGVVASLWATRFFEELLYGVSPTDPATYFLVCGVLGLVALAACCVPTLRAVRVDPLVTLRSE